MIAKEDKEVAERLIRDFFYAHDNSKTIKFIIDGNYSLVSDMSSGKELLPTPDFFEKISQELGDIADKNCTEAKKLCEKYYKMVFDEAIKNKDDYKKFAEEYEKKIQPIGKRIFNYLILARLYRFDLELQRQGRIFLRALNRLAIIIAKEFAKNPHRADIMYNSVTLIVASIASVMSFIVAGGMSSLFASVSSSLSVSVAIIIISIAFHHFNDFEHVDISGKNILALKYKTLVSQMSHNSFRNRQLITKKEIHEEKSTQNNEKFFEIA